MKNETTEATLFSWEQFVNQADEIERIRKKEQGIVSLRITFPEIRLQSLTDKVKPLSAMRESPTTNLADATNTPDAITAPDCPRPTYALSWGEWCTKDAPFEEGFFIWIASRDGWLFSLKMPRLLLPRDCFWLN